MATRSFGVELRLGPDVERAAAALVVRRERHELEDPLDVPRSLPPRAAPPRLPRTSPWAHGQALIPVASTPTTRRDCVRRAAAIPTSDTISCVASPLTGVTRRTGHRAVIRTSARSARCRPTMCAGDVLGERLDEQRLGDDDRLDRLLEQLGEPRHVDALLLVREVDGALDLARPSPSRGPVADAHGLLDAGDAGARQRQAHVRGRGLEIGRDARDLRHAGYASSVVAADFPAWSRSPATTSALRSPPFRASPRRSPASTSSTRRRPRATWA